MLFFCSPRCFVGPCPGNVLRDQKLSWEFSRRAEKIDSLSVELKKANAEKDQRTAKVRDLKKKLAAAGA